MIKKIILILLFCLIFFVGFSYARVEYLTSKYGDEFKDGYRQTNMIDSIEYLKVLEYDIQYAKVLYIDGAADYIWFKKENNQWIMEKWDTVWSDSGSADGITWPPYF